MSPVTQFADVTRVRQAGKGYYMYVTVDGKGFWSRINKDIHDQIKLALKTRNSKKEPKKDEPKPAV